MTVTGSRLATWGFEHAGLLYAQRRAGRKMHLVASYGDGTVSGVGLCGVVPDGRWRMTSNVPWGHACRSCRRARNAS